MARRKAPEIIDVPSEALEGIKSRIGTSGFAEEEQKIILSIIGTYSWLMSQLQSTKLTIHRLKKMFGFSTEKHNKVGSKQGSSADFSMEGTSANQVLSLDNLQGISKETHDKETPEKK
jgi:hypothetical protein